MNYRVLLTKPARKQLDALPDSIIERVSAALLELRQNPRPPGCKKMKGREGWRIRVGDYRVLYSIQDDVLLVLVVEIGHRREIYR